MNDPQQTGSQPVATDTENTTATSAAPNSAPGAPIRTSTGQPRRVGTAYVAAPEQSDAVPPVIPGQRTPAPTADSPPSVAVPHGMPAAAQESLMDRAAMLPEALAQLASPSQAPAATPPAAAPAPVAAPTGTQRATEWTNALGTATETSTLTTTPELELLGDDYWAQTDAHNSEYVDWLRQHSMLSNATVLAREFAGTTLMWQNPYAIPEPQPAIAQAPLWLMLSPASTMTASGKSYLGSLMDPTMWRFLHDLGVRALSVGAIKQAGGIEQWQATDSQFHSMDRISQEIDVRYGSSAEYRQLCDLAASFDTAIVDDIVMGNTGLGADFALATMKVEDYTGLFHMVEVPETAWQLLPTLDARQPAAVLSHDQELRLADAGVLHGPVQVPAHLRDQVDSMWAATGDVLGIDGITRRWVYMHRGHINAPSLNWFDGTYAAQRLVTGDVLHSMTDLGAGGIRLRQNQRLGSEAAPDGVWVEGHPVEDQANATISSMVRKLGGFSVQERHGSAQDIAQSLTTGSDISYDTLTHTALFHAMATQDTEFLRLCVQALLDAGINTSCLIRNLQTEEGLNLELPHFSRRHANDLFDFRGGQYTGAQIADVVRDEMLLMLSGEQAPYHELHDQHSLAVTTVSAVAAGLGHSNLRSLNAAQVEQIASTHLLLMMFNALQPGAIGLSVADLMGALPLGREEAAGLIHAADASWLGRGATDLLGQAENNLISFAGVPKAQSLYGYLDQQLTSPRSFATRIKAMFKARTNLGLHLGTQLAVLGDPEKPGVMALLHELPDGRESISVFNFSETDVLAQIPGAGCPLRTWKDLRSGTQAALSDEADVLHVRLPARCASLLT